MNPIQAHLAQVHARIEAAARQCGRNPAEIRLVAVSKTRPAEDIATAHACGQRAFGENYLQEAEAKIATLAALDIEWHFIGKLQSNKTRPVAELFDWVHGLASLKHARRLNEQRPADRTPLQVCLQINLSGEGSKGGIGEADTLTLARAVATLPRLRLRGLMTLPAPTDNPTEQRAVFARLARLKDELNEAAGLELDTLSMGMSGDLESAVCEGATLVRVGTAVFGPRRYPGGEPVRRGKDA
jgi:pyridoxal phosphate enzyme (YggS family)